MKLADLRKLSIKQKTRIHFALAGGLECVITEHGIAQVPGLRGAPEYFKRRETPMLPPFFRGHLGARLS